MPDHPELAFVNRLSGKLEIELSEPPTQLAPHMLNLMASPTATIVALRFKAEVYEQDDLRALTEEELDSVAFDAPRIVLRGDTGEAVAHEAPDGASRCAI